jgi:hypothetical protein
MQVAARPYVIAAAALAAVGSVAGVPLASRPTAIPTVSMETRLVDSGESILNIPFNLFQDIVNIPGTEVGALDQLAASEFMTTNLFVVSPTNLFGIDPGDPGHFEALVDLILPFKALSGLGGGEFDQTAGLGQQLVLTLAAELPVTPYCDGAGCLPDLPTSPITGLTGVDTQFWNALLLTGAEKFPLIDNFFQVPLQTLANGYTFNPPSPLDAPIPTSGDPGYYDPSGSYDGYSFTGQAYNFDATYGGTNLLGTTTVVDPTTGATEYAMPWTQAVNGGEPFTLNPLLPFENFFNSLMQTPDLSVGSGLNYGFDIPSFQDIFQAFESLAAGSIALFDPFTPGSFACSTFCAIQPGSPLDFPALVQDINKILPGDPLIQEWLTNIQNGTANVVTPNEIAANDALYNQGTFDFANAMTPPSFGALGTELQALAPSFESFFESIGLYKPATAASAADLSAAPGATDLASTLDLGSLSSDFSSALSTDLSALLASFGATLPADVLSMF